MSTTVVRPVLDQNIGSLTADVRRVGPDLHGKAWIGSLTMREQWLVGEYVTRSRPTPDDAGLRAEIARAVDRDRWMTEQFLQAVRYLSLYGAGPERERADEFLANLASSKPEFAAGPALPATTDNGPAIAAAEKQSDPPHEPIPATNKTAVPANRLREYMNKMKAAGGPIPAADRLFPDAVLAFPEHRVTREDVRTIHTETWGRRPPGPRRKNSAT